MEGGVNNRKGISKTFTKRNGLINMWTVCICGRVTKDRKIWIFPKKVTKRVIKRGIEKGNVAFYHCPKCASASQS